MKKYRNLIFALLLLSSAANSFALGEQSTVNNFATHVSYKRPASSSWMSMLPKVSSDGSVLHQYVNASQAITEGYYTFNTAKSIPDLLNQAFSQQQTCESIDPKVISQNEKEAVYSMHGINCKINWDDDFSVDSILYGKMMLGTDGIYELMYFAIEKINSQVELPIQAATSVQIEEGQKTVGESSFV